MALGYACELLADVDDLACDCDLPDDEALIDSVLEGASDFLALLSVMPLGRCTQKYRPCRDAPDYCYYCTCCHLLGIHLPGLEPAVTEVKINGAVINPSEYVIMVNPVGGQVVLERIDSDGRSIWWPRSQVITRPSTGESTFEITVESGMANNYLMTAAAAEIACDTFRYLANQDHLLPTGVVTAIAGGISMGFLRFGDPTDQETMNIAGLALTQRFLLTLPGKPTGTQILSPELDDGWALWQRR